MLTSVNLLTIPPENRPQTVAGVITVLSDALKLAPPPPAGEPVLTVDGDGTLNVISYREVTGAEKLAKFIQDNADVTKTDLQAAANAKP